MPPVLFAPRLRLRPPELRDAENFFRLNSSPRVMHYINGGRPLPREEAYADLTKRLQLSSKPLGYWVVEALEEDAFYGWVALKPLDTGPEVEVGYRLLEEVWGRGLATEAASRVLRYGFEELRLPRIVAVAMPENAGSRRVMEKIGLHYVKEAEYYQTHVVYYALQADDYFAARNPHAQPSARPGR